MERQQALPAPWSHILLPESFYVDAPPVTNADNEATIWGPLAITIPDALSWSPEQRSAWKENSEDFIVYLKDITDPGREPLWEWCTNRDHVFEPNREPKVEDGILKLNYMPRASGKLRSLWIRPLTVNEWQGFLGDDWASENRGQLWRAKFFG